MTHNDRGQNLVRWLRKKIAGVIKRMWKKYE